MTVGVELYKCTRKGRMRGESRISVFGRCFYDYNRLRMSSGESTTWSAPAPASSERVRNPHDTPTLSMPARCAVSMSTALSPTYSTLSLDVGWALSAMNTIDGSGLTGTFSWCPSMAAHGSCPKKWLIKWVTARWYLLEVTAVAMPRAANSSRRSEMPG